MSVTLKQIAAELNVSQPLVTYALNGKPGVSPRMRQAIIETAERLGYHKYSNQEARMLAARRHGRHAATGMIALIFPRFNDMPWTVVPYFKTMVDGVEYEAGMRGLDLVIAPYRGQDSLPRIVLERGVDGVILLSPPLRQEIMQQIEMPVVSLGAPCHASHNFLPDDEAGIELAIEHLLNLGHRRIAYLGAASFIGSAQTRLNAYRSTLEKHGITIDESLIDTLGKAGREDGQTAMERLLGSDSSPTPSRFTALVCHNDLVAMGAIDYAATINLRVPEDLSVVGFDDVSTDYNFEPAITSISFSRFDMGRSAVELICKEVRLRHTESNGNGSPEDIDHGSQNADFSDCTFPVELVVRKSSGNSGSPFIQ